MKVKMKQKTIYLPVKILFLTLAIFSAWSVQSPAQIVMEHSFLYSGTMTQLEKEGPKFYLMDVTAKECRIYNLDYSLFKTIRLDIPADRYLYDIQFVTQNLFDTDDGVELLYVFYQYVQTATSYYYVYTTRVADENGSVLLDLPGGSWSDIRNISGSGSRMLTWITDYSVYPYPVETRIFRLPGQMMGVEGGPSPDIYDNLVYPNPTSGFIRMRSAGLAVNDRAEWVIMDSAGKLIARVPIQEPGLPVNLKSLGLVAGIYLVRLESKNHQTKFQQVVLDN